VKKIEAIIKPFKLGGVKDALYCIGIQGITVTEVGGFGRQKGHVELYCGAEYDMAFVPKAKIEAVVSETMVEKVIRTIQQQAGTGKPGDGKIFVSALPEAAMVRAGEKSDAAVQGSKNALT